jgi:hypothetical protein
MFRKNRVYLRLPGLPSVIAGLRLPHFSVRRQVDDALSPVE